MQKIFVFVIAAFIAYGCASTKKVVDISIGTWDYVITETPQGDLEGNFVIAKEGDNYTGSLNSEQGSIPLEDVKVVESQLSATFDFQGYEVIMSGTFEGASYKGNVSVDYNEFPMSATKRE